MNILVIDSGWGGLSVVEHIRRHLPGLNIHYIADHDFLPYGDKADSLVEQRILTLAEVGVERFAPDAIVIACNTASTIVLPALRKQFSMPIVGVVPAIKPAALESQSSVIGLIATPNTIDRQYTQDLVDEFAKDKHLVKVGSLELVAIAEDHLNDKPTDLELIKQILEPLEVSKPEVVVLACTHFPHIQPLLNQALSYDPLWLDSGDAIARRVSSVLNSPELMGKGKLDVYTTSNQVKIPSKALFDSLSYLRL